MAGKGSRYKNAVLFSGTNDQPPVFKGFRPRAIGPATGVLEHTVKEDDRLDLLALYFYVDSRNWWRILDANPEIVFGADLTRRVDQSQSDDSKGREDSKEREYIGDTILIPRASEPGAGR